MATKIELEASIKTADSAKSLAELRKSLKELINLQAEVGKGSKEFDKLAAAINDTEGKIGDLTDSFNTLKGSGIDRVNNSLSLLKEGFAAADPGKMSVAFTGLKAAMASVPIFLLLEGFKLLVDNIGPLVKGIRDTMGWYNEETKAINKLNKEIEREKEVTESLSKEINRQLSLMQAQNAGVTQIVAKKKELIAQQIKEAEMSVKLNQLKIKEIENNDSFYESLLKLSGGFQKLIGNKTLEEQTDKIIALNKKDRQKEFQKSLVESLEVIKDLKNQELVETINANNALIEEEKKARDLRIQNIYDDKARELAALKAKYSDDQKEFKNNAAALAQLHIKYKDDVNGINLKYIQIEAQQRKEQLEKEQKLREEAIEAFHNQVIKEAEIRAQQNDEIIISEQTRLETISSIKSAYNQLDKERLRAEQEELFQRQLQETNAFVGINQQMFNSLQGLSDTFFAIKSANTKKGSKEELEAAKKQFKINKAIQISQTIMSGTTGVINALGAKSILPEPFATIAKAVNVAAIVATTAASVAKISSQQFQPNGGGSSGAVSAPGAGAAAPAPPASSAFNPNTINQVGVIGGNNTPTSSTPPVQKVVVLESDITKTQNKVAVIQSQARI